MSQPGRAPCPECGELIATTAKHCRFCEAVLSEDEQMSLAAKGVRKILVRSKNRRRNKKLTSKWKGRQGFGMILTIVGCLAFTAGIVLPRPHPMEVLPQGHGESHPWLALSSSRSVLSFGQFQISLHGSAGSEIWPSNGY